MSLMNSALSRLSATLCGFSRNGSGAAAVEFALIAPLMIAMYLMTVEITQAIDTARKVSRLADTVADLITQETKTNPDELKAILSIGGQVLQPYRRTAPTVTAEGIQVTSSGAKVVWAAKFENGRFSMIPVGKNSKAAVPPELDFPDTFVVRAEARLDYRPMITWSAEQKAGLGIGGMFDSIQMAEAFYLRPRASTDVKCVGC